MLTPENVNESHHRKTEERYSEKILKHALFYHRLGFSIVPAKGKIPIVPWKRYQKEKPSRELIEKWFSQEECNIALITGKISGIVVIDVDDATRVPQWLKKFKDRTWIARTRRGYHFYFRIEENQYVPCARLGEGIDLKGEGGIVILPPSKHPEGGDYVWIKFTKKVGKPAKFAEVKPHIGDLSGKKESGSESIAELYRGVREGERNVSLTRIAGSLFADGLTPEEVYEVLKVVNQRNQPPLPDKEVRAIVKSIAKRQNSADRISNLTLVKLKKVFQGILQGNLSGSREELEALFEELKQLVNGNGDEKYLTLRAAGSRFFPSFYGVLYNVLIRSKESETQMEEVEEEVIKDD